MFFHKNTYICEMKTIVRNTSCEESDLEVGCVPNLARTHMAQVEKYRPISYGLIKNSVDYTELSVKY